MNTETQEKLFNNIASWADSMCEDEEAKQRFYIYLGAIVQSQLMGDFVYLKENCPKGYDLAGDMPLLDYIQRYDLNEVYDNFIKKRTILEEGQTYVSPFVDS